MYESSFYFSDYGSLAVRTDQLTAIPQNFSYFTWIYNTAEYDDQVQTLLDLSA
jgi:ABC-type thiamine transport system substrate-binding protein